MSDDSASSVCVAQTDRGCLPTAHVLEVLIHAADWPGAHPTPVCSLPLPLAL